MHQFVLSIDSTFRERRGASPSNIIYNTYYQKAIITPRPNIISPDSALCCWWSPGLPQQPVGFRPQNRQDVVLVPSRRMGFRQGKGNRDPDRFVLRDFRPPCRFARNSPAIPPRVAPLRLGSRFPIKGNPATISAHEGLDDTRRGVSASPKTPLFLRQTVLTGVAREGAQPARTRKLNPSPNTPPYRTQESNPT